MSYRKHISLVDLLILGSWRLPGRWRHRGLAWRPTSTLSPDRVSGHFDRSAAYGILYLDTLCWLIRALVISKVDYTVAGSRRYFRPPPLQTTVGPERCPSLMFSARMSDHTTPLFCELHWLRLPEWIQFRLCALHVFMGQLCRTSPIVSVDVSILQGRRCLRSSVTTDTLAKRSTLGDRTFCVAGLERSARVGQSCNVSVFIPSAAEDFPVSTVF